MPTDKNPHDREYAWLVAQILEHGVEKGDRTGTGTYALFGRQMEFDLTQGFPLLTLKKTPFRYLAEEMFWFIEGGRDGGMNNNDLLERGVDIWTPWAKTDGSLGPVYGWQWRNWFHDERARKGKKGWIDQLAEVEDKLRNKPDDRRMIVSAWNVAEIESMALPPCHLLWQVFSRPLGEGLRGLELQVYQRSCDMFIGVPFNIAQYALLAHLLAHATGHEPLRLSWIGGDCHVYLNHEEQARLMLGRDATPPPRMEITTDPKPVDEYTYEDLSLVDYDPHPAIKAPVAV